MGIDQLGSLVSEYIDEMISFNIEIDLFNNKDGLKKFNKIIREKVEPNRYGIYVWSNEGTKEVVYVGMAGTINQKGQYKSHSIRDRLTASRAKDENGKDIQTNKYVSLKMRELDIEVLSH